VLELEDLEDRALDVDVVAVLELVRRYDGESVPFAGKKRMWLPKVEPGVYFAARPFDASPATAAEPLRDCLRARG
jgi:hypothetical protein